MTLEEAIQEAVATDSSDRSRLPGATVAAWLEKALESLSEDQRALILLRNYKELSFSEIGRRLGRSPEASRRLYARAMVALTNRVRELADEAF